MKYQYVVCGAGRQGTAVIYDLIQHCEAKQVIVYEPNAEAKDSARYHLTSILEDALRSDRVVFVNSLEKDVLKDSDAMLSCAPYYANEELTTLAILSDLPYCDLGGNPDVVRKQKQLVERFSDDTSPVVPECGLAPGIANVLAAHLAAEGAKTVKIRCGGLFMHPDNGFKLMFSADGLVSEYSGRVPIIRHGKLEYAEALDGLEEFTDEFEGERNTLEAAYTSNSATEVVQSLLDLGVQNYDYKTLRYKGHWGAVQSWKQLGLFENPERLAAQLAAAPEYKFNITQGDADRVVLSVEGTTDDVLSTTMKYEMNVLGNGYLDFAAMEFATSWGITTVAHYLARFNIKRGFWTPESHTSVRNFVIKGLNERLAAQ